MFIIAYLRKQENVEVSFLIGKCREVPTRNLTDTKLEMQAAVFDVRLEERNFEVGRFVQWTDSTTVLQWVHASNSSTRSLWQTALLEFSKVQLSISRGMWKKMNTDLGIRGMTIEASKESA